MNITKMLLTNENVRPGTKITPRALVIHYTANNSVGADADNNRNYFQNLTGTRPKDRKASCHYCVDDHQVILCIPEDEMAYHVGASNYKQEAMTRLGAYPNRTTLGIEMAVNQDGDFEKTYQNTVELAADILIRHGWFINDLWRHYDITGKNCPAMFVENPGAWEQFKKDVQAAYERHFKKEVVTMADLDAQPWAKNEIAKLKQRGLISGDHKPSEPVTFAVLAKIANGLADRIDKIAPAAVTRGTK